MAVNYICKPQVIVDKELGKFMSEKPDHEQSGSGTKMLDTNLSTKSLKNDKNIVESRETESALSSPMTPAPQYGLDSLSNPSNHIYSKVAIIVQDVPDYESPNTYNFNQQAIQNDDELELQQGFNQAYESNANNQNVYEYMNDIDESVPVHISNTDHYQHQVEVYQHVDIKSQEFQVQAVTLEVKNQVEYIPWESIPQEEHQEHQGYVPEPNYETENFPRLYDQTVAYEPNDFNKQENNTEPLSHDNIDPQSFVQESFIQDYPQEVQQQGVYQIQDFDQIPESEFAPAPPPPPPPPPALVQTARKWPTVEAQEPIFKWGSKKATEYFSFKEEDSEELQESNQGIPSALGFSNGSNEV